MSNFLTVDILRFRIENRDTGKAYDYDTFEEADAALNRERDEHGEGSRWIMVAEINA